MRLFRLPILLVALALGVRAADLSGTWNIKVTSSQGEHAAKLTLRQQGEKLSGAVESDRGEHQIAGSVKGDQIEFAVQYTGGDAPASIPFRGTIEAVDKMSGRYDAGDSGGAWTAAKNK